MGGAIAFNTRGRQGIEGARGLNAAAVLEISVVLRELLGDAVALHVKTRKIRWQMSAGSFRDGYLLVAEHGDQIFAMIAGMAERLRQFGGASTSSIGDLSRGQRQKNEGVACIATPDKLKELLRDNRRLTLALLNAHEICERYNDNATAGRIESWIDQTERRVWCLFEMTREL